MNFLDTVKQSIYSPAFYSKVPKTSFSKPFVYFLFLILLLTIIQAIVPAWGLITVGQKQMTMFVKNLANSYPSELEVTIDHGMVSTNVEEPYVIPLPQDKNRSSEQPQNLVVIDTKTPFSVTQFNNYNAAAWVTKDAVFTKNSNGQIRTMDLSKISHFVINKSLAESLYNKISPWLVLIMPLIVVFMLFGIYMVYLANLLYLFFLALLIWLLARVIKKELSYGQSYKVGLYAMTLGFIVDIVFSILRLHGFPFMFTILTLAVVFANLSQLPQKAFKK